MRSPPPAIRYLDRVLITQPAAYASPVITGTVVVRWNGPPDTGSIYTVVLDRPLMDGRCVIDAAEGHLLVLTTTS
jgi:hypothetical protein